MLVHWGGSRLRRDVCVRRMPGGSGRRCMRHVCTTRNIAGALVVVVLVLVLLPVLVLVMVLRLTMVMGGIIAKW